MRGEKIYEYDLDVTGVTDYGVSPEAILTGKDKVPPQEVRIVAKGHHRVAGLAVDLIPDGRTVEARGGEVCACLDTDVFQRPVSSRRASSMTFCIIPCTV